MECKYSKNRIKLDKTLYQKQKKRSNMFINKFLFKKIINVYHNYRNIYQYF